MVNIHIAFAWRPPCPLLSGSGWRAEAGRFADIDRFFLRVGHGERGVIEVVGQVVYVQLDCIII